jgi:hypothetical protein
LFSDPAHTLNSIGDALPDHFPGLFTGLGGQQQPYDDARCDTDHQAGQQSIASIVKTHTVNSCQKKSGSAAKLHRSDGTEKKNPTARWGAIADVGSVTNFNTATVRVKRRGKAGRVF